MTHVAVEAFLVGNIGFSHLSDASNHDKSIPSAYVNLQRSMKQMIRTGIAKLVRADGKSWDVNVYKEESKGDMHFGGEGLLQFAVANGLDPGYILIFCYKGNMEFTVRIFGSSGCEIVDFSSYSTNEHEKSSSSDHKEDPKPKERERVKEETTKMTQAQFECAAEENVSKLEMELVEARAKAAEDKRMIGILQGANAELVAQVKALKDNAQFDVHKEKIAEGAVAKYKVSFEFQDGSSYCF